MGVGCLIPYCMKKEQFSTQKASTLSLLPTPQPLWWGLYPGVQTPRRLCSSCGCFSALVLNSQPQCLPNTCISTSDFWSRARNSVESSFPPATQAEAGGWAGTVNKGGAERGARGPEWRASLRQEAEPRRRARACIPPKHPEPEGRRHPGLRLRPSPSKVTLD